MKSLLLFALTLLTLRLSAQEPKLIVPIGLPYATPQGPFFSGDGSKIALGVWKSPQVNVWDAMSGHLLGQVFAGDYQYAGYRVNFSPDNRNISIAGSLLDIFSGEPVSETDSAWLFAKDPGGKVLALVSDTVIKIIDFTTKSLVAEPRISNPREIEVIGFSNDGQYLAVKAGVHLYIFSTADYRLYCSFEDRDMFTTDEDRLDYPTKFYFPGNNDLLILYSGGGIYAYDLRARSLVKKVFFEKVDNISIHKDGRLILISSAGTSEVFLYDLANAAILKRWTDTRAAVFNEDGQNIITLSQIEVQTGIKYIVRNRDLVSLKQSGEFTSLTSTYLSPMGNYVLTVADTADVKILHPLTGKLINQWDWHGHVPNQDFSINCNGNRVVSTGPYLDIWDIDNGKKLASRKIRNKQTDYYDDHWGQPAQYVTNAAGNLYFIKETYGWQLWDLQNAKLLIEGKKKEADEVYAAITDSGEAVVVISTGSTSRLQLIDVETKKTRSYNLGNHPVKKIVLLPGQAGVMISYATPRKTEMFDLGTFRVAGAFRGEYTGCTGKGKIITCDIDDNNITDDLADVTKTRVWNAAGKLLRSISTYGSSNASPTEEQIVDGSGTIYHLDDPASTASLEKLPRLGNSFSEHKGGAIAYSSDGNKIIASQKSEGSGGSWIFYYVWDAKTYQLIYSGESDTMDVYNEICTSKDGTQLLRQMDDLQVLDLDTKQAVQLEAPVLDKLTWAGFSNDGHYVYGTADRATRKWDARTGKLLCTFFSVDSTDYFVQLPSRYYSCSPNAARLIHYVDEKLNVITFDQMDVRYNRPDMVLREMGSTDTLMIRSYQHAYEKRMKKLGIDTSLFTGGISDRPESAMTIVEKKDNRLTIHLVAKDTNALLDRYNVWVNEVPVFGIKGRSVRYLQTYILDTTITITLSPGTNNIEASAVNVNGMESYRAPRRVEHNNAGTLPPAVYFIGIGINKFQASENNLHWSVKDIRDLAIAFKSRYKNNVMIDTLFNDKVTVDNISALKSMLAKTKEQDKVILAYSGHGLLSSNYDFYLSTWDMDFQHPEEKGIPYEMLEDLLDSIPARQKLVLLDACHSGELDKEEIAKIEAAKVYLDSVGVKTKSTITVYPKRKLGMLNSFELMRNIFADVSRGTGTTIISAAGGMQFAQERGDLRNGVFTYSILDAFKRYAHLNVSRLKQITAETVTRLTNGLQKPTSRNETGYDWAVW